MLKKKVITTVTTGALMLALLTPLTNALNVDTNTTANVSTNNGSTSVGVSNQTGASVLGNTVNTSTSLTTQLGL